jgi:mannose-6-phosphate isomerase-like protein (cupin superfamily)
MGATIVRKEEAPQFDVHGAKVVGYASPSRGSGSVATWRVTLDAGAASPLHTLDVDEVFVCLGGTADFDLGGEQLTVRAGDALTVTAGTWFRFSVRGDAPFEAIACVRAGCQARVGDGAPFTPPWAL